MHHVFKVRPPHTRCRNIPQERQQAIREGLSKTRRAFKIIHRESYKLYAGRWTDAEWDSIDCRHQALRDELDGYLNELRGHGPAALLDRVIHLWNTLGIVRIHLQDAKDDRTRSIQA